MRGSPLCATCIGNYLSWLLTCNFHGKYRLLFYKCAGEISNLLAGRDTVRRDRSTFSVFCIFRSLYWLISVFSSVTLNSDGGCYLMENIYFLIGRCISLFVYVSIVIMYFVVCLTYWLPCKQLSYTWYDINVPRINDSSQPNVIYATR